MRRKAFEQLKAWKGKKGRKPLVLKGARQVGKTHLLRAFGAHCFPHYFYINFEQQAEFRAIFEKNLSPALLINELNFLFKQQINIEMDLLIFDEIQACPNALTSLKYFCEEMPELALCSAGSLLGVQLNEASFPVGKVEWLNLYPMCFEEFLEASDESMLVGLLRDIEKCTRIPQVAHQQLWEQLKIYFVVGGLPEVVSIYQAYKDQLFNAFQLVRKKQNDLKNDYYADIAKHSGKVNAMHIDRVLESVPTQLARTQNSSANKFKFKGVVPGIDRYRRLANVIDWLVNAGLLIKVKIVDTCRQPLKAYAKESQFKLFLFDVGLLGAMSELDPAVIMQYDYGTYKGYFAENFVCQELLTLDSKSLYSWHEKSAEVEFLKDIRGMIIPIEVKAGFSTHAKSLKVFSDKYDPPHRIILSAQPKSIGEKSRLWRLPLYLTSKLVDFS